MDQRLQSVYNLIDPLIHSRLHPRCGTTFLLFVLSISIILHAVLVPLLWHPGQPTVLLTRREAGLRHHAGQISFPGGKQEADDASACATALREAHEEIGLCPERVAVVGELPAYVTVTGFCVTPVVGLILPPVRLTAQVGEVAEIFELPLPLALNPDNYVRHDYQQEGRRGQYLSLTHGDQCIWGATAAMLRILLAALAE